MNFHEERAYWLAPGRDSDKAPDIPFDTIVADGVPFDTIVADGVRLISRYSQRAELFKMGSRPARTRGFADALRSVSVSFVFLAGHDGKYTPSNRAAPLWS